MQKDQIIKLTINNGELHLRNINVFTSEIVSLINDLDIFFKHSSKDLRSFSFSYNRNLGEAGLIKLLEVLPKSISILGLVDCGLGNKDMEGLLQWVKMNPQISMICIENNVFSNKSKEDLVDLSQIMSIALSI